MEDNLRRVANFQWVPPRISIYCGDDFISKGSDGQWYKFSEPENPTLVAGDFRPCSATTARGYVLRSQTAPLLVLCPLGLATRMQIGESVRHLSQINVLLDDTLGVSTTILHEFLHIANPSGGFEPVMALKSLLTLNIESRINLTFSHPKRSQFMGLNQAKSTQHMDGWIACDWQLPGVVLWLLTMRTP
jgi:hypothetical protein